MTPLFAQLQYWTVEAEPSLPTPDLHLHALTLDPPSTQHSQNGKEKFRRAPGAHGCGIARKVTFWSPNSEIRAETGLLPVGSLLILNLSTEPAALFAVDNS